jgi:hypothetical protein
LNADRRKRLELIMNKISDLSSDLEVIQEEEQEAYDNLPESLQNSERGENMSTAIDAIDNAKGSLGEAISSIEEAGQ